MERIDLKTSHVLKPTQYKNKEITPAEAQGKFADSLKQAIDNVNQAQVKSSNITDKFISGEVKNLHDVMIAAQKASVTRAAAIEVRNKAVEAYKEIMRMQV